MIKKLLITVLAISLITIAINAFLGGYDDIQFEKSVEDITIYGIPYNGEVESPTLDSIITSVQDRSKRRQGKFTVIDYFLDSDDSIKQFIGFVSPEKVDMQTIELKEVTMLKAIITSHPIVMPLPEEVKRAASKFALESEYKLDDFSIEIYDSNNELTVLFPVKAQ